MTAWWPRLALAALLVTTAVMYLWDLSASGYGNTFYAAAAQAGSQSWSAWFFGSLDAQNFITVDKPPASLWVTGLAVRVFGTSSWSVLAPQALMCVAAVAILFATVRRVVPEPRLGVVAGLVAGSVLAFTPAAALMFRFNNPDALLTLLLTVAAYCLSRAVPTASWRWLALVGVAVGTAFLTKMLQAFLVLPGFGVAYLLLAPTTWRRRLLHVAGALAALVVSAGWWVAIVQLIPAGSRPYVGGSTNDTVMDLVFGYNGLSRLAGREPARSGASVAPLSATTGLHRLFTTEMGNEISWLLPVALFACAFGGYLAWRGRLGRDERAAAISWGCWLLVTGLIFSFMQGTVHPYYTVALAPAIAALVALGAAWAWRLRAGWDGRLALLAMPILGGWWSSELLARNHFGPEWLPLALRVICVGGAIAVLTGRRAFAVGGMLAGAAAALAGTVAFSVATVATPHHGAIPNAARRVAVGGRPGDAATEPRLAALLVGTHTTWSAATNGAQSAAALELSTQTSVMAIGGWSGDPTPTLTQFVDDVDAGRIAYYVEAGRGGDAAPLGPVIRSENHSASHAREITDWVAAHYPAVTIGTSLVYRLAA